MAWPNTVVPGQTATAAQYNALVAALQTWGGDVDAGNYALKNAANLETQLFTANGGASQGTPLIVTSANAGGTSLVIENTATGGHRFAFTDTPAGAWLTLYDVTAGQGIVSFATTGANARSPIKLPAVGVIGFASGNNLPSDPIDVGIQRNAAGVLQISDSNGVDRDLRVRAIAASGSLTAAGDLQALTLTAQSSAGSYLQLAVASPNAPVGAPVSVRANGPIAFDSAQPVNFSGGVANFSAGAVLLAPATLSSNDAYLRLGQTPTATQFNAQWFAVCNTPINPSSWWRLGLSGGAPTIDFSGGTGSGLTVQGTLLAVGRITSNFDYLLNKSGTAANYFQIVNDGRFAVDPTFYPASGSMRTQGNIYASGNVSGLAWVPHGSGASLDEIRQHMRSAKTETTDPVDGDVQPEQTIPVGAVNFLAEADGLHVFGKKSDTEIWEAVVPWSEVANV